MDIPTILRQTVAEFFQLEAGQVTRELDFRGRMSGSVARARLDAAIRERLKIVCPQVYTARTYAELEAAILGKPFAATAPAALATSPDGLQRAASAAPTAGLGAALGNVACGIDLESPEQFPIEADYWESEFYRTNFSRTEIAYCVAQADPRQHFAARWCAKESLKKCDTQYLSLEMNRIEVVLDESGRPALHCRSVECGGSRPLPVAVSLTHLGSLAAAVVVKVEAAKPAAVAPSVSETVTAKQPSTAEVRLRRSWWRRLFG